MYESENTMGSNGSENDNNIYPSYMHIGGEVVPAPELMTMDEVIIFLRIPEISTAKDYANVIKNLIRMRGLPRIHICQKLLFPRQAILEWVMKEII